MISSRFRTSLRWTHHWSGRGPPLPTNFFQNSLPALPVPNLDSTLKAYLDSLRPLIHEDEYERVVAVCADFAASDGIVLQRELEAYAKSQALIGETFISKAWLQTYLSQHREALPLSNPFLQLRSDRREPFMLPASRAANLAHAAASFFSALKKEILPPDVYTTNPALLNTVSPLLRLLPSSLRTPAAYLTGSYPLCQSQYNWLFGTTRVAGTDADTLRAGAPNARHIVLAVSGHMYAIDVLNIDGPDSPAVIEARIRFALEDARKRGPAPPLLALTGLPRIEWALARSELNETPDTYNLFRSLDDALFVITMDQTPIQKSNQTETMSPGSHSNLANFARIALVGDGGDRSFDKSFSFIVAADGTSAITFEHAWGDGIAVVRLANDCVELIDKLPLRQPSSSVSSNINSIGGVVALNVELNAAMKARAIDAQASTARASQAAAISVYRSDIITRNTLSSQGISPDAALQLALQIAHTRIHGGAGGYRFNANFSPPSPILPPTYESSSTAAFKKGRTETVRSATNASAEAVRHFLLPSDQIDVHKKVIALRAASSAHKALVLRAVTGKGADRHLFALRNLPGRSRGLRGTGGLRGAALFDSPVADLFFEYRLSTSTLASPSLEGGGFGPISTSSYGVAYGLDHRGLHVLVSAREGAGGEDNSPIAIKLKLGFEGKKNAHSMGSEIVQALKEINEVASLGGGGGEGGGFKGGRLMAKGPILA